MALSINDPETVRLARALAAATGESLTVAIRRALEERLARETHRSRRGFEAEIHRIQQCVARLPVLDPRPAEEILGHDEHGLPR